MAGVAAVLAALAAGCGGKQTEVSGPSLPRTDRVVAIRIEGNRSLASRDLTPALGLYDAIEDRQAIDPYLLALDTDRVRTAYLKHGFFAAQVTPKIEPRAGGKTVVFVVVEGRRSRVVVELVGLPPELPAEGARELISLEDGAGFDYDAYDLAKEPLRVLVANAGYAHAEVRATVVVDAAGLAHARYEIDPGRRCFFGQVTITGTPHPELVDAIRGRLHFRPGQAYSLNAMTDSRTELYALGRFATVQLVPKLDASTPTVDVAIAVTESIWNEYHYGGGLGYEPETYEARLRLGATWVPRPVPKLTLGADAQLAEAVTHQFEQPQPKIRGLVSAEYFDLFKPRLVGRAEVGADDVTVEAYRSISERVRLSLASPVGFHWLQLRVGWVLSHVAFSNISFPLLDHPELVHAIGLDHDQRRGAYEAQVTIDLRDNPFDPRFGMYVFVPFSKGTKYAGGDLTYNELTPEIRGYVPLGETVLAARVRFGGIFGDVPVLDRYYSGGTSGQRGYSDRQLSPRAVSADGSRSVVFGGAGLVETGAELRRLLGTLGVPIGGNLFVDGGDVTQHVDQLDLSNLTWAVGAGVWTKLGGLKIRIDVGYRLNRRDPGILDNIAPHIGIGDAY